MSALVHDSIWIAKSMNIKTVLTDHSLIGFADVRNAGCKELEMIEHRFHDVSKYVNLETLPENGDFTFEPIESAIVCNKLLEGTLCDKLTLGRLSNLC